MAWGYNADKVRGQIEEFQTFLGHARGNQQAGLADLFGRPFAQNQRGQQVPMSPAFTPQVIQAPQININYVNYYVLQAQQLFNSGLITQGDYANIVNRITSGLNL